MAKDAAQVQWPRGVGMISIERIAGDIIQRVVGKAGSRFKESKKGSKGERGYSPRRCVRITDSTRSLCDQAN